MTEQHKCTKHPAVRAVAQTGTEENPTYLCDACLRVVQPVMFISLHQPPNPKGIR